MENLDDFNQLQDGPDINQAQRAVQEAKLATRQTDKIVTETHHAITVLKKMHEENHFADKLRLILRGT